MPRLNTPSWAARTAAAAAFHPTPRALHRLVAALLVLLVPGTVLSGSPLLAQAAVESAATPPPTAPHKLTIVILDGEGALNNIRERDAREPIVQVEDENHRPVAGAAVLFAISNSTGGAGATFNSLPTLQVTTGSDGIAHATGFQPNRVSGHYALNVTATLGSLTATVAINEANFLGPLNSAQSQAVKSTSRLSRLGHLAATNQPFQWVLAGALVTSVAFVGAAATNSNPGTVITPGTGTVTAPSILKATGKH